MTNVKQGLKQGIIVVDKPAGITSFGVVSLVRKLTGVKRVGHGGTLDPMAEGVLPVFVGSATRLIEYMHEKDDPQAKKYEAAVRFGYATDTQDITGKTIFFAPEGFPAPTIGEISSALATFGGSIEQLPPAYSAIKHDGKKLYEYARAGKDIPEEALKPRKVMVSDIHLTDYQADSLTARFEIICSGGLYVRTICHDLGMLLGCGATMSALRRLKSGPFTAAQAVALKDLESLPFLPLDSAVPHLPHAILGANDTKSFLSGIKVRIEPYARTSQNDNICSVYSGERQSRSFIGIGEVCSDGYLKPRKVINESI